MGPRLNKRQQRELEELEALAGTSSLDASSGDELPANKSSGSVFSKLLVADAVESESDEEGSVQPANSRKKKKNKKKHVASATSTPLKPPKVSNSDISAIPKNQKKALKKAKAKQKKASDTELEQALAELSAAFPSSQKPEAVAQDSQSLAALLSVSLSHLDSEAEMRKFFGVKVVRASKSNASGSAHSSRRQAALQKSNLTRPQPSWWSASQREGLSIRALTEEEVTAKQRRHSWTVTSEKWWTIAYSQRYKGMSKLFFQAVMSGDPDALWEVQRKLPWHADNLLQLAEVYRHREEYAQAVDFVDRAIFTYERAFIGAFNFTSGLNRLDFDHVENRPFYLAIHRQVADLQRRGCVRTAFEFARLLYSLDPGEDPHGALYHLDLLALKSGMMQWLVDLYDHFTGLEEQWTENMDTRLDPSVLPGFTYARALALKMLEETGKSSETQNSTVALEEALLSFPSIVPLLADKIDVALPAAIRSHSDFVIETDARSLTPPVAALHALSHMYVLRSFSVWKEPKYSDWFVQTATQTFSKLPATLPVTKRRQRFLNLLGHEGLQYSIYRHITVLESTHSRLFSFIPPRVLEMAKSLACDPLPPYTALSRYDDAYFEGTEDIITLQSSQFRHNRALDNEMLERLIPNANIREAVIQTLGGERFLEILEGLDPGEMEDLIERMQVMRINRGDMPGQMPEPEGVMWEGPPHDAAEEQVIPPVDGEGIQEDTEGDMVESESDSDEEDPSTIQRYTINVLRWIWGARTQDDETSSDEADVPIDGSGVD